MMKLVTVEQMKAIDAEAVGDYGISGRVLMENAGRAAAEQARALAGSTGARTAAVVCGKGNNGGDGFVCARYLEKYGLRTGILLLGRRRDIKGDARANLEAAAKSIPVREISSTNMETLKKEVKQAGVIIDAILGTGAKGAVKSPVRDAVDIINESGKPVLSVDIPSGLDGDTGVVHSACVRARETVTMAFHKTGLLLGKGPEQSGRVTVADIGLPPALSGKGDISLLDGREMAKLFPARPACAHKGSMGRVLVIAGSVGYTGAGILAAKAALRCGCGMVMIGVPRTLNVVFETALPEAVTIPLPETEAITVGLEAEDQIAESMKKCDAIAIGPGLGRHPETAALVKKLVMTMEKPMIIDADGLNCLAGEASILGKKQAPAVITPHPGELAALKGKTVEEITASALESAREIARGQKTTTVLKQAKTIIADTEGRLSINPTGNPGMATAGSGDVLTGITVCLAARGLAPESSAALGVYLHGLAGDSAAGELTEEALIAGDIIDHLPAAIRRLRAGDG